MSVEIENINFSGEFEGDLLRLPSRYLEKSNPLGGDSRLDVEDKQRTSRRETAEDALVSVFEL